jgi:hypothetical protein
MNILIPAKEADVPSVIALSKAFADRGESVTIWSHMPHEAALGQSEYTELKRYCDKASIELVTTTEDSIFGDSPAGTHEPVLTEAYAKAFFSCQYFTGEFFDRDYAPALTIDERRAIFRRYIAIAEELIIENEVSAIICVEETTEFGRAALGYLSEHLNLSYYITRRLENGQYVVLDGYSGQIPLNNSCPLHFIDLNKRSLIRFSSNWRRFRMHFQEIKNTIRFMLLSPEYRQLRIVGSFRKRFTKTIIYILRDARRWLIKPRFSKEKYQYLLPLQTFPESSTVVDAFPHVSLTSLVTETSAILLSAGRIAVTTHPDSDYEISLKEERHFNRLPNVDIHTYWSGQNSETLLHDDIVVISGYGNFGIYAFYRGYKVVFPEDFWFCKILPEKHQTESLPFIGPAYRVAAEGLEALKAEVLDKIVFADLEQVASRISQVS